MQYYNYTIVIEPDEDAFHAYAPALRGCHSCGDTYQEAKDNIKEAIELYLESLLDHNEEIPIEQTPFIVERIAVEV
jgi:predicted RNase H-like HicB family nuclease